jgi:hypothetical protein
MGTYWDEFIDGLGDDVYRLQQDPRALCERFWWWLKGKYDQGEAVFGLF